MDIASTKPYLKEELIKKCDKCGNQFKVTVTGQDGHNSKEAYFCPQKGCSATYEIRGSMAPELTLIKGKQES